MILAGSKYDEIINEREAIAAAAVDTANFDQALQRLASLSKFVVVDDDLDGQVDEVVGSSPIDDDEDSSSDEDPVDRLDNDMDGSIDEDPSADINGDGYSGIKGLDDDGDGLVDEHGFRDDDEDGMINEDGTNEIIFWVPSGTTLRQDDHLGAIQHILSERVTFFQATQVTSQQILVEITLTAENGETVRFAEQVCPRNVLQTCGKRVR